MRIVSNFRRAAEPAQSAWFADLDAALAGEVHGRSARGWRELRNDVRELAPPMSPGFEEQLAQRLGLRAGTAAGQRSSASPSSTAASFDAARRRRVALRLARPHGKLARRAPIVLGPLVAVVVALFIVAPWHSNGTHSTAGPIVSSQSSSSAAKAPHAAAGNAAAAPAESAAPLFAPAAPALGAGGRLQALSASITLRTSASAVQGTSDRVAQLASREGGFVQSSHVASQNGRDSEAELLLHVPSAKLSATLAAISRLAPVRAESQSLQDLTTAHGDAQRRLQEAKSARRGLLHSLSRAVDEEEVEALERRLTGADRRIAAAEASLEGISRRAQTSEVEVTILGRAKKAGGGGLTLDHGLHDALEVLVVTLVVLLIGAAALVPLALVLAALLASLRSWRRYRRESALDAR